MRNSRIVVMVLRVDLALCLFGIAAIIHALA